MAVRPEKSAPVVVRDQAANSHRARVEEASVGTLVFVTEEAGFGQFTSGDRALVTWPDETALVCLPTVVLEVSRTPSGASRCVTQVVGEVWYEQRRKHLRGTVSGVAMVSVAASEQPISAEIVDLSEAAVRAAIDQREVALLQPGSAAAVELTLGEERFDLPSKVLSIRDTGRSDGRHEVIVLFDRPVAELERLRSVLQARQNHAAATVHYLGSAD